MLDTDATPLKSEFTEHRFVHRLIERRGNWCLFARGKPGMTTHFEVIRPKISRRKRDVATQTWVPSDPYEVYPRPEQWGANGFTFSDELQARAKMEGLQ